MSEIEAILSLLRKLRPTAKFLKGSHSADFIDAGAQLENGFYFVSLYDEKIDANVVRTKRGIVIINNTYLASFAYNVFLCCLYHPGLPWAAPATTALLKHNFKKFFAEQLLYFRNNIFSRAVLLETLLFEQ